MINPLRPVPHNQEAEQALLGAVLMDNRAVEKVRSVVAPDDFYVPAHARIWTAVLSLADRGERADPITLKAYFEADDDLGEAGGVKYLARLVGSAPSLISVSDYARTIRDLADRRRLIEICEEVVVSAGDPLVDEPAAEIAARAEAEWSRVTSEAEASRMRTGKDVALAVVTGLNDPAEAHSTGIAELDQAMAGGLLPGRTYGFVGRKKTGKTVLAATISAALDSAGVKHLFVAAEMGSEQIVQRLMAHRMGAYSTAFLKPQTRCDISFQRAAADCAVTMGASALFMDAPGLSFERLRRYVAAAHATHGITGVILDYLQLVGGQQYGETQAQLLDRVCQWIANIGRELGIWWVVLGQENQEGNVRGGEGMRLAFDQVYRLCRSGDDGLGDGWLEMMETRYTAWMNVGSESRPALLFNPRGPMFEAA